MGHTFMYRIFLDLFEKTQTDSIVERKSSGILYVLATSCINFDC